MSGPARGAGGERAGGLRLGYLVPEFPTQTHIFFWREAAALGELGVDVHWLSTRRPRHTCPHPFARDAAQRTHYAFPPRAGTAVRRLLSRPGAAAEALGYLARLRESSAAERLRRLGLLLCAADLAVLCGERRIEHLHAHSCAEAAHLVALTARLAGLTYSLTLHGDLEVYGGDHDSKMAKASFVSTVTADLQRQVTGRLGLRPERVPVIRMGVDTEMFAPPAERSGTAGRLNVVTVARLAECKGHRYALAALRRLVDAGTDARYTIAGDGEDRDAIAAEAARLELAGRVRFTGGLAERDVLALLHDADAFVLPSVGVGEAAPVALMEAMATGLPAVCSIIGGVPEMLEDGVEGYLVPQADSPGLAAALARLAADPPLRSRLGAAARARAVAEFAARRGAAALLARIRGC
jgi:colanic acid/amylovoran biosynthesis glycosyltransferase